MNTFYEYFEYRKSLLLEKVVLQNHQLYTSIFNEIQNIENSLAQNSIVFDKK